MTGDALSRGAPARYLGVMFQDLFRRLMAPEPATLPDLDARRALAALLVRLARADGRYAGPEVARIDHVLAARYGLAPTDAALLRGEGEAVEQEAPDTVRFTRAIKDAVPFEDRVSVVEALWEVALADGARGEDEEGLVRLVAPLLGVTDQESGLARQRAQARAPEAPAGPWA